MHIREDSDFLFVPFSLINLSAEPIVLDKSTLVLTIHQSETRMEEVYHIRVTNAIENKKTKQKMTRLPTTPSTSQFISSPADVLKHRRVALQDAEVPPEIKGKFEQLCKEYEHIFSTDRSDIGQTDLITLDIDTGDHTPIAQKPYTLPLKRAQGVKNNLKGWRKQESLPKVFYHKLH